MKAVLPSSISKNKGQEKEFRYTIGRAQILICGKKDFEKVFPEKSSRKDLPKKELLAAEEELLIQKTGMKSDQIFCLHQLHGNRIHAVDTKRPRLSLRNRGDALYTKNRKTLLVIRTADCLPFFLIIRMGNNYLTGVIHAGWRGLRQNIVFHSLLRVLQKALIDPSHWKESKIYCLCGPHAGKEDYEVGSEVAKFFTHKRQISQEHYLLDLRAIAKEQMELSVKSFSLKAGLKEMSLFSRLNYISSLEACTIRMNESFYSHRCADRGRNLNTIWLEH